MNYFLLNAECYFVKGALRGAIYNCHSGKIISLDPQLTQVISKSEQGAPLKKIPEYFNYKGTVLDALNQLKKMDIGRFYESYYKIEKLKPPVTKNSITDSDLPKVSIAFIELNNSCNLDCAFCKKNTYKVNRMTGCKRWPDNKEISERKTVTIDQWKEVIKNLSLLNCKNLVFIGGEPLLNRSDLLSLINYAKSLDFIDLQVFTNGLLIDDEVIKIFKKNNVKTIVQVYSHSENITDYITRKPWTHKILLKNIERISVAGINFVLNLVVLEQYSQFYKETLSFFKKYNPEKIVESFIYQRNALKNNGSSKTQNYKYYRKSPDDIYGGCLPKENFFLGCERNACWFEKISFTENGDVIPCPMARKEVIGNLNSDDFWAVVTNGKMDKLWNLSRDEIELCKDCEYRYFCKDCRPLEKSLNKTNKLKGRTELCLYNPYTGKWGDIKNG